MQIDWSEFYQRRLNQRLSPTQRETSYQYLRSGKRQRDDFIRIPRNHLILGASDRDYDDAVTIQFPSQRRITIVISGGNGVGKTIIQRLLLDQINGRYGHPCLCSDVKLDLHQLLRPNITPKLVEILAKYGIKPRRYDPMYVSPKFMDLWSGLGKQNGNEASLSLKSVIKMDKDTRTALVSAIFSLDPTESGNLVISKIMMRDEPPETWGEFGALMNEIMEEDGIKSPRLKQRFDALWETKKISDDYFNYAEAMMKHGIVVLEGSVTDEKTAEGQTQGAIINDAIYQVVNARTEAIRFPQTGIMKKIPYIFMDEASNQAGQNGLSASIMTAILTKWREISGMPGVGSVVATQFLHELAPKIVAEAEYVICPKTTHPKDLELLKLRNSDIYVMDDMYMNPNDRPNDWVCYGRNGMDDYQIFVPLPCQTFMGKA